jgi:hypothetical protein
MRVLFHFSRRKFASVFHALAQYWSQNHGISEFAGLVVAKDKKHAEFLEAQREIEYKFIDRVDDIEIEALETEINAEEMNEWERQLGFSLMQFVVADRHIGHFYNTAGIISPSPMMRLANNPNFFRKLLYHHFKRMQCRIDEFRPTVVILGRIAAMNALMLVRVCQLKGIPCLWLAPTRIKDRYMIVDNISEIHDGAVEDFEVALQQGGNLSPYWHEAETYVSAFQDTFQSPEYHSARYGNERIRRRYQVGWLRLFSRQVTRPIPRLAMTAIDTLRGRPHRYLRRQPLVHKWALRFRQAVQWKLALDKESSDVTPDKDYIYFPLSVNPEASTMVLAPNFVDPLMVVECLSKNVPATMDIYVKEHKPMIGLRRRDFYEKLRSFPNVRLISALADGPTLMRNARLTVVVTGTSGWESLLVGTPVLTFAQTSYTPIGLTRTCTDLNQVGTCIRELLDRGFGIPDSERHRRLVTFVASTLKHSFVLKAADIYGRQVKPGAYDAATPAIKILAQAFEDALRRRSIDVSVLRSAQDTED